MSKQQTPIADLIEALQIFEKYIGDDFPTNCSHDELWVCVDPSLVNSEDKRRLDELGFFESDEAFKSFTFGSC